MSLVLQKDVAQAVSVLLLSTLVALFSPIDERPIPSAAPPGLEAFRSGIRLKATTCPDGEGHYYVIGLRPSVQGLNDACIDVSYRATCSTNEGTVSGTLYNFVGGGSCFSDPGKISPKPTCDVKDVKVVVADVAFCK